MAWIGGNRYLSLSEMDNNSLEVYRNLGTTFTLNALCAMLGNFRHESTVNPQIWESLEPQTIAGVRRGYGLAQWTPWNKLADWANDNGLDYTNGDTQCKRILYELQNNLQWGGNLYANYLNTPPFNFAGFAQSNLDLATLTLYFTLFYERPAEENIEKSRQTKLDYANRIYTILSGIAPPSPEPPRTSSPLNIKHKKLAVFLLDEKRRRKAVILKKSKGGKK